MQNCQPISSTNKMIFRQKHAIRKVRVFSEKDFFAIFLI